MVKIYWEVGQLIVEHEQRGEKNATYGQYQLKQLSEQLQAEFGKGHDDNPTIGLILCSQKSEAIAKYSVLTESKQLFSSKYLPYLPTEDELRLELERERTAYQLPNHDQD